MDNIRIREIAAGDNKALAIIIRTSLAEFGANKPGTVYYDDTTDHLYELFQAAGSGYFVPNKMERLSAEEGSFLQPAYRKARANL